MTSRELVNLLRAHQRDPHFLEQFKGTDIHAALAEMMKGIKSTTAEFEGRGLDAERINAFWDAVNDEFEAAAARQPTTRQHAQPGRETLEEIVQKARDLGHDVRVGYGDPDVVIRQFQADKAREQKVRVQKQIDAMADRWFKS